MGFGNSAQKEANKIAQEQLNLQKEATDEAKADEAKAELEAESEAKRQEEERLKTTPTRQNVGKGIGRLVR
jgi:hypothetical protein